MQFVPPFHEGEIMIQERTGERNAAIRNGRIIKDRIPPGAIGFIANQQYCVLSGQDALGRIWTSFLAGSKGFAKVNDDLKELQLQLMDPTGILDRTPPLADLQSEGHIGVLFIEFATRRRLRVNGKINSISSEQLTIEVRQAYPNCPKYIQRCMVTRLGRTRSSGRIREGCYLDPDLRTWISKADTLFVGSAHPEGPMDVSHRGGSTGFVQIVGETLRIPDYPGNSMFNTFGNLLLNPHAGVTFVDFNKGRQLQLTGDVALDLDDSRFLEASGGTGRWWEFRPKRWRESQVNNNPKVGASNPPPATTGVAQQEEIL